ncbi:MAG TPA: DNA-binding domain-containing protein [Ramlibacter sp.]|nr:DNA-binding domain-containing protein [Ramlibacter sp.]
MTPLQTSTQAQFAAALLEPSAALPANVQAWDRSDPARRFDVYRNNVVSSLVDALAQSFPVVQDLVGEEFFRAMAGVFVRQSPPRSCLLARYGSGFPDFVAGFEPAKGLPYLPDVARLEMARLESLHAADATVLGGAADFSLAAADRIGELRLAPHPSVRLVPSGYAVVSIWAAHQGICDLGAIDPWSAESALVVRPQWDVVVVPCDPGTVEFVLCLQRGCDLAQSAGTAAAIASNFDLSSTLGLLLRNGALTSMELPDRSDQCGPL